MKVLITGGAGFIGSMLARALHGKGVEVVVVDDLSLGRLERLDGLLGKEGFTFLQMDVCNSRGEWLRGGGIDGVLHLAALPRVRYVMSQEIRARAVNVGGSQAVVNACLEGGVKWLVHFSSSSVYGNVPNDVALGMDALRPMNAYAVQKLEAERIVLEGCAGKSLRWSILRPFNVVGEGVAWERPWETLVGQLIYATQKGRPLKIYGDGSCKRDFTWMGDVVDAVLRLVLGGDARMWNRIYNVGSGENHSVNSVIKLWEGVTGRQVAVTLMDALAEAAETRAILDDTRLYLGWEPRVGLEAALRAVWESVEVAQNGVRP